jgi:hypothetical protein
MKSAGWTHPQLLPQSRHKCRPLVPTALSDIVYEFVSCDRRAGEGKVRGKGRVEKSGRKSGQSNRKGWQKQALCEPAGISQRQTPVISRPLHSVPLEPHQPQTLKIRGFHGCDYQKLRLLGYKNRVRTSQETHYFSATESSQLMLCKI